MIEESDKIFLLDKSIWTEEDFEIMGWHDSLIYAISLGKDFEFIMDIDYIFKWVHPNEDGKHFKFWVAPCTLIFENVYDLKSDFDISEPFELEIADITRDNPKRPSNAEYIQRETEYDWKIETQQGEITFTSVGYKQVVRQLPIFLEGQTIGLDARNGISFSRHSVTIK